MAKKIYRKNADGELVQIGILPASDCVTIDTEQTITGKKTTTERLSFKVDDSSLPSGYSSAIVTISGSGIDTGIAVSSLTIPTIETSFKMISVGDYDWFGTTNTSTSTICCNISSSAGTDYIRWGSTSGRQGTDFKIMCDTEFHVLKIQSVSATSHFFYVDGVTLTTKTYEASFTNTGNIYIGRGRTTPASSWKYFKIMNTNANILLFNGIACYDESTGKYGFYDTVSGTFKTASSGITGTLNNSSDYALVDEIPTSVSELTNDAGFITSTMAVYGSLSKFPTNGNTALIYVASDTNYTYRYDEVLKTYIEMSRPYKELTEVSTDIIVNGEQELIIGDSYGAKQP